MAAESVVSFIAEKLGSALIHEVILLKEVRQQFERLQKELLSITGFLKTADARRFTDPNIRIWVSDVRDIAYDVDDVLDSFFLKFASTDHILKRAARYPRKIIDAHQIGKEIETIFSKLDEISKRRDRYGITNMLEGGSTTGNQVRLRRSYAHAIDEDVVGFEEEINTLVGHLVKKDERLRVITICGIGGGGKTTLAKKVYHHKDVTDSFDCKAWTFISQEGRLDEVLQDIIRQVNPPKSKEVGDMKEVELVAELFSILEEKCYLVVLDDIWSVEHWDELKPAFPSGKSGSRVMITTRIRDIGKHADPWGIHVEPRPLTADESWDLICKKVFPKDTAVPGRFVSSELEKCGRDMALKCSGLPLAVIVLAGILASKNNSLQEWQIVSKHISVYMNKGEAGVMAVLALSYTDLPYHLKPLFLFLGLFPEDHRISVKQLILMWIAEGMISEVQGDSETMEEVGRHHMDELIHRCMVQIAEKDWTGRVKKCLLHDKMRDLCIKKGAEENFFGIVGRHTGSSDNLAVDAVTRKVRRCVINHEGWRRYVFPKHLIPQVRTVFFMGAGICRLNIVYQEFKLVKVLQLQGSRFHLGTRESNFCKIIGKLTNLRYLGLRDTFVERLPKSIGNLLSLQTIDARGAKLIADLPDVIWKMRKLRHLYIPESYGNSSLLKLDTLQKLQTLGVINYGPWIVDLVKLTNLNKLAISRLTTTEVERVIDIIGDGLDNLVTLSLAMLRSGTFSSLNKLSEKKNLLHLSLRGEMRGIPSNWPPNITRLRLYGSALLEDPMPTLQMLQNLAHLVLRNAYTGTEMVCAENGFPQLRYLAMESLSHLKEWKVDKGAMPCLTACKIHYCDSLEMVPQGFQFVTTLQELSLIGQKMCYRFRDRVKEGGKDWIFVRKIPSIIVKEFEVGTERFEWRVYPGPKRIKY